MVVFTPALQHCSRIVVASLCIILAACGGGSSNGDNSFSDPGNLNGIDKNDEIEIEVNLINSKSGVESTSVNSVEPISIAVVLENGNRKPLANKVITAETTLGVLNSETGGILTDTEGHAVLTLVVTTELPGSAGTITITYLEEMHEVSFDVVRAPVQLGSVQAGSFSEGKIFVSPESLSANGQTQLSVSVLDMEGNSIGSEFVPIYTSRCAELAPVEAIIDQVSYTADGEVNARYTAAGCVGVDRIGVSFADLPGHEASGEVTVSRLGIGSISYIESEFEVIALKGSQNAKFPDSISLTFLVVDGDEEPAQNRQVTFSLSTDIGGINLDDTNGITDANGEVHVTLHSGTIPTVVRVIASIVDDTTVLSTTSDDIIVSAGRPDQNSFSLAASILNPGGYNSDGNTSSLMISAADIYNAPVPDGTVIFFLTEFGKIQPNCTTENGVCSIEWTSQNPREPLFSSFNDGDGKPAFLRTVLNTNCPNNRFQRRGLPCPSMLGQPIGGRSTILAYTQGDENFIDANGNGLFDSGEAYKDLPEAFLDHNEDGAFGNNTSNGSCFPNCPDEGGNEELFIDANSDGVYNTGNGIYNGSLCSSEAQGLGSCSTSAVTVSDSVALVMSGSQPYGVFYTGTDANAVAKQSISLGSAASSFAFYASDLFNGKLPFGTTVQISSATCPLQDKSSLAVSNTNSPGPSVLVFTVKGGSTADIVEGEITATISVPTALGGTLSESYSIPCTINACGSVPAPDFCNTCNPDTEECSE